MRTERCFIGWAWRRWRWGRRRDLYWTHYPLGPLDVLWYDEE